MILKLLGLKFKNLREMKNHNGRLNEDDGSESGFSGKFCSVEME